MPESETERLKRLREKQLRDRDPLERERKFQRNSSIKEKRMQKPISLREDWQKTPYIIKIPYAGAGATLILIIFGIVLGSAIDLREDIKKHLK